MNEMYAVAVEAHKAGLSVVPPRGKGIKAPITSWAQYQNERPSLDQLGIWYGNIEQTGLGAVMGRVSGNAELFEFDDFDTFEVFRQLAKEAGLGDLITRLDGYCEETPNGIHYLYRCEEIGPNTKLAQRLNADNAKQIDVLIETRGEGGYVILAPTHGDVHPSGKPYKMRSGSFATIPVIDGAEREQLFALAQTLDEMPRTQHHIEAVDVGPRSSDEPERPGDYFNRTHSWADVLQPHGWAVQFQRGPETYWTRPGRERVTSATTNYKETDLLKVFSTSTTFDTGRTYDKFGASVVLDHGGSFADAARAVRASMPRPERKAPSADDLLAPRSTSAVAAVEFIDNTPQPAEDTIEYRRLVDRLMTTEGLLELPPPEWMIEGILPKKCLAVVWGAPGSYKSFLVLDWALCLASGAWWKGHKIDAPGKVLYVAAEGVQGLPQRVKAWSTDNGIKGLDRASWLPVAVNILHDGQYEALGRVVADKAPDLIVVDTLARAMPGADENGAQDMGRLVERADALRNMVDATLILVHHSTKEGSTARGSGSLLGAVDVEVEVKKEGSRMALFSRKQKDAEDFTPISLHAVKVDGSLALSLTVKGGDSDDHDSQVILTVKRIYRDSFGDSGASGTELRKAVMEETGCSESTWYRIRKTLLTSNYLVQKGSPRLPFYEPGEAYYLGSSLSLSSSLSLDPHSSVMTVTPSGALRSPEGDSDLPATPIDEVAQNELWDGE